MDRERDPRVVTVSVESSFIIQHDSSIAMNALAP